MPAYADNFLLKIKNRDRKLFAIIAPIVGGVILGGQMLIQPMLKAIKTMDREKASYSQKEAVYKNILDYDKKLEPFRKESAKEPDKTEFIEQLNSFASKSGLNLLSVTPDEKKVGSSGIESILIRIDSEGTYHQIAQFVSLVESLKTHARITSLDINRDSGAAETPSLGMVPSKIKSYKISLALTIYFGTKN